MDIGLRYYQQTDNIMKEAINRAVEVMREGGIILYPTDTVWGIGCDASSPEAVEKIYALKRSENKKSMLILCSSVDNVLRYSSSAPAIAFEVMDVIDKPTTVILPGATGVAANLIPEERTIGVRVPNHEFCQQLLRRFGRAIVSTSANISGEATPLYFNDISPEIIAGVDYIVDKKFEGEPTRLPSSIIAFNSLGGVSIIRE